MTRAAVSSNQDPEFRLPVRKLGILLGALMDAASLSVLQSDSGSEKLNFWSVS